MIVVYTTSHDWAHTIRVIPILNELFNYRIEIVTTVPEYIIRSGLTKFRYRRVNVRAANTEPGFLQSDAFTIDLPRTVLAWKEALASEQDRLAAEVARLRSQKVRLVISDISYFGQLVAESLKVPSICVATFDWPFIFRGHLSENEELNSILDHVSAITARFDCCMVPGVACEPLSIGREKMAFDWVCRKPQMTRTAMRQKLNLSIYQDAILLSFAAHEIKEIPVGIWTRFNEIEFFVIIQSDQIWSPLPPNLHLLRSEEWSKWHVDVVNTVDIVIGKLGYGLVSEVLHCKTKFLAVCQEGNPEYEILMKALKPVVPYREITREQFVNGDWYVIRELIEIERRPDEFVDCPTAGEVSIARSIMKMLGDPARRYFNPWTLRPYVTYAIVIIAILVYFFKK
jgi:hypothetical protein